MNAAVSLSAHNQRNIVGVIDLAEIVGDELRVAGRLYDKNMATLVALVAQHAGVLGMSFEASNVATRDQAGISVVEGLQWTGCAILRRDKAAFAATSIQLAA